MRHAPYAVPWKIVLLRLVSVRQVLCLGRELRFPSWCSCELRPRLLTYRCLPAQPPGMVVAGAERLTAHQVAELSRSLGALHVSDQGVYDALGRSVVGGVSDMDGGDLADLVGIAGAGLGAGLGVVAAGWCSRAVHGSRGRQRCGERSGGSGTSLKVCDGPGRGVQDFGPPNKAGTGCGTLAPFGIHQMVPDGARSYQHACLLALPGAPLPHPCSLSVLLVQVEGFAASGTTPGKVLADAVLQRIGETTSSSTSSSSSQGAQGDMGGVSGQRATADGIPLAAQQAGGAGRAAGGGGGRGVEPEAAERVRRALSEMGYVSRGKGADVPRQGQSDRAQGLDYA